MQQVIIMVLPNGVDIIAEFVKEAESNILVKPPKILNYDPSKKSYTYADFCVHRDLSAKIDVPINKSALLTWYFANLDLSKKYIEMIRVQNLQAMGVVLPTSVTNDKITF